MTSEPQNSVPPPTASGPSLPTNATQDSELEKRLLAHEKAENRVFEVLKWGMGIFTTAAVLFTGFNWWSAKTNYDRDKEYFQNKLTLVQNEMSVSNDKQMSEIQKQAEASFAAFSNSLQNEFLSLQQENDNKWTNLLTAMTNGMVAGFAVQDAAIDRILAQKDAQFAENVTNIVRGVNEFISHANKITAGVRGMALMLQGTSGLKDSSSSKSRFENANRSIGEQCSRKKKRIKPLI
jgi:hypothetical protein